MLHEGEISKREGKTNNEGSNANGLLRAGIDGNRTGSFARACTECGAGETRLRARNPERRREEDGYRVVTYPPGAKSPAHHHARSAFIYAYVLSGAIRSQVGDEPAKVYQVGEGFYEVPGSHHENASDRDPASLLAVFVVDSKDKPLTIPDQK